MRLEENGDEYDFEVLSSREENASRAIKSALVGVFVCPLQLYTTWLILKVLLADEPLRTRYFWSAIVAGIVLLADSIKIGIIVTSLTAQ